VTGSSIDPIRRALVPLRPADLISFRVQQSVQRLLHAATHGLVNMSSQLLLVDADRASERFGCILCGVALLVWFDGSVATAILPDRGHCEVRL
jgi:SAM-dependent methyltransferase